jgi:PAP2 superfamily
MNTTATSRTALCALASLVLLHCSTTARADAVTDWNEIIQATVVTTVPPDPARWARTTTIAQVAVFEAVNSIVGDYEPYRRKIQAPSNASPDAAAIVAAHRVLVKFHPDKAPQLDAARDKSLAAIPDSGRKKAGIIVGTAAADAIIALRANDGFDAPVSYTPGTNAGEYRPTPPEHIPAYRPGLGQVATFVVRNGRQFRADPPPSLSSRRYTRDYEEVKTVGEADSKERPDDRTRVARFYDVTDADGIYYPAARQIVATRPRTLSQNARLFALLSMAIFDAAVTCFETKYHYNLWRPVTAIHEGDRDGNDRTKPDPNWRAAVFTPPFPSYTSGHATFGAAARAVLEDELGLDGHSITLTNPVVPDIVLKYTTFKQITDDIDDGRIYGGVHYRFDQEEGATQGKRVGEYVLKHALRSACRCRGDGRDGRAASAP